MTDYTVNQSSFNAGEISPQAYARVDIDRYGSACKTLKNYIPLVQGPAERRPGTEFVEEVKDSTKAVRLIPFEFSTTQAYILELGDQYIRFYKDGGQILGGEMVTNGSMELDSGWADENGPTTNVQSYAQQYGGLYSRHFTVAVGADEGIESDVWTSEQSTNYTLNCRVYPDDTTDVKIRVRKGDDSGWLYDNTETGLTENAWNLITISLGTEAAGEAGAGAYIQFLSTAGAALNEGWFIDSVSIKKDTVYEIASPYLEAELFNIDVTQSADTMYLAHENHEPRTLTRSGHDEWALEEIVWVDGPYLPVNDTDITLEFDATAVGAANVGASLPLFYETDIGRLITQKHTTTWGVAIITEYTDSLNVAVTITRAFIANTANVDWRMGYWSDTTGFPRTVIFDKERLIWAATDLYPQTMWLSKVGAYTVHSAGVDTAGLEQDLADDDALVLELNAKQVTPIMWMEALKRLTIGSSTIEWWVASATGDGPITANSKQAVKGSFNGGSRVQPAVAGNTILYLNDNSNLLRELYYSYEQDSFVGEDLSIISEHLTRVYGIVEMTFQKAPFGVLWMVREDGALIGLTYDRDQEVKGMHFHSTDGKFESVAKIPGSVGEEIWFVIQRTIGGSDVRYIEKMHDRFLSEDLADAFFVDSGLTLDNRIAITDITSASPAVMTTASAHGLSNGDHVLIRDVVGVVDSDGETAVNYYEFTVANVAASTAELKLDGSDFDSSQYTAYISGGTEGKMYTSVSGLSHLEGETVALLTDGAPDPPQVVAAGAVSISGNGASVVHVGLPYNSDLATLNPEIVERTGSTQNDTKSIKNLLIKLYRTLGLSYGEDEATLVEYPFTSDVVPMSRFAAMLSGDTDPPISFEGHNRSNVGLFLRQSEPLPSTIAGIVYEVEIS